MIQNNGTQEPSQKRASIKRVNGKKLILFSNFSCRSYDFDLPLDQISIFPL